MTEWIKGNQLEKRAADGDLGGTMRLGAYPAHLRPGTKVHEIYGADVISERHRHRYEVNVNYKDRLEQVGLRFSGMSPDGMLPEIVEIPGPSLVHRRAVPSGAEIAAVRAASAVHVLHRRGQGAEPAGLKRRCGEDAFRDVFRSCSSAGITGHEPHFRALPPRHRRAGPGRLGADRRAVPGQGRAPRPDLPALSRDGPALLGEHRDQRGQPQGGGRADAAAVRLRLCRLLLEGADERERGAAARRLELQPQARRAGAAGRELQRRLPLPGGDQRRALCRAAQHAARPSAYGPVSIFYRDPTRQRRPPQRPCPLRRPDRPRPLGHLQCRQSARRAGLRRHLHQ